MDSARFDEITRNLTAGASRRQLVGGLLGGAAAMLTGAAVLEAKKGGNGKGKAKGRGKGKGNGNGTTKVQFCHRNKKGQGFNLITVGSSAAKAHANKHGDEQCSPPLCQKAIGCSATGACEYGPVTAGTACVENAIAGTCNAEGVCIPNPTP